MKLRRQSRFHQISIHDRSGIRTLKFGDVVQTTMKIDDPSGGALEYIDFFHVSMILRDGIRRVLFVGLGGGSGPTQFRDDYPGIQIDVIEIDEEIVRLAAELFEFQGSSECRIHVGDGLEFLEQTDQLWDLIIIDAYMIEHGDLVVPDELTTEEFFRLCKSRLSADGVLVFNSAATVDAPLTREVRDSLSAVFRAILGFEVISSDNAVLLASDGPLERRPTRLAQKAREGLARGSVVRRSLLRRCRQVHRGLSDGT